MRRHAQHPLESNRASNLESSNEFTATRLGRPPNEWELFYACGVKIAAGRIISFMKMITVGLLFVGAFHISCNGFDMHFGGVCLLGSGLCPFGLYVVGLLAHEPDKTHFIWVGCLVQLLFFAVKSYFGVLMALAAPNELMQHRVFLTVSLVDLVIGPFTYQMPPPVFIGAWCPLWMSAWLYFHHVIGFLQLTVVIFGATSCVVICYFQHLTNQERWESFQTRRALEGERKLLMTTQKALHGMLSILWDASCHCNTLGDISSTTPHLQQLLGVDEDLVGSNICAFAADPSDVGRLQEFLRNSAAAADQQALKLHCALRPESAHDCGGKVYDVALYSIKLPQVLPSRPGMPWKTQIICLLASKPPRPR